MKRLFDIAASLVGLVFLGWLVVVLAWRVRKETPGAGILSQPRVGRHRAVFICYKLRSMHAGTLHAASHETPVSAVTPLGATLRRYKLDELPQLWNVLKGDMSFVGPRPCLPVQERLIEARDRLGVFAARPGITGLAQVQGVDMSDPDRLAQIDATYLKERTFVGDLVLILRTVTGAGRGDRVRS